METQLIILFLLMIAAYFLLVYPKRESKKLNDELSFKRHEAEVANRSAVAQMLGGALVLAGLYFSAKTYSLTRDGQITERLVKSLELLKSEAKDAQLGGIYALERIAFDSEQDHATIFSILCARARRLSIAESQSAQPHDAESMQAIAEVVSRRKMAHESENSRYLDLRDLRAPETFLFRASLHRINLKDADLNASDLRSTNWNSIYAEGLQCKGCVMTGARFGANVNFKNARFDGANLQGIVAQQTFFSHATFHNTDLKHAKLIRCNLESARIDTPKLEGADFSGAYFKNADLHGQDFTQATVKGANFLNCNLNGTKFKRSQLSGLYLGANIPLGAVIVD